jgi:hypothetical protein
MKTAPTIKNLYSADQVAIKLQISPQDLDSLKLKKINRLGQTYYLIKDVNKYIQTHHNAALAAMLAPSKDWMEVLFQDIPT